MKRVTKNELKDGAILMTAFSWFEYGRGGCENEIFMTKHITKIINDIQREIKDLIDNTYSKEDILRLVNLTKSVASRSTIKDNVFTVTCEQLGLQLLYFGLAPNERKGKPLTKHFKAFFDKWEKDIKFALEVSFDNYRYTDTGIDSESVAYKILEELR